MKLIDSNVSLGEWPFGTIGITSARNLKKHLEASGIETLSQVKRILKWGN